MSIDVSADPLIYEKCKAIGESHKVLTEWGKRQEAIIALIEKTQRLLHDKKHALHIAVDANELYAFGFPALQHPGSWTADSVEWHIGNRHGRMALFFTIAEEFFPLLVLPPHEDELELNFEFAGEKYFQWMVRNELESLRSLAGTALSGGSLRKSDELPTLRRYISNPDQISPSDFSAIVEELSSRVPWLIAIMTGSYDIGCQVHADLQRPMGGYKPRAGLTPHDDFPQGIYDEVKLVCEKLQAILKRKEASRSEIGDDEIALADPAVQKLYEIHRQWEACFLRIRGRFYNNSDANDVLALSMVSDINRRLWELHEKSSDGDKKRHILIYVSSSPTTWAAYRLAQDSGYREITDVPRVNISYANIDDNRMSVDEQFLRPGAQDNRFGWMRTTDVFRTFAMLSRMSAIPSNPDVRKDESRESLIKEAIRIRRHLRVISSNLSTLGEIRQCMGSGRCVYEGGDSETKCRVPGGREHILELAASMEYANKARLAMGTATDFVGSVEHRIGDESVHPLIKKWSNRLGTLQWPNEGMLKTLLQFIQQPDVISASLVPYLHHRFLDLLLSSTAINVIRQTGEQRERWAHDLHHLSDVPFDVLFSDKSWQLARDLEHVADNARAAALAPTDEPIRYYKESLSVILENLAVRNYWNDPEDDVALLDSRLAFLIFLLLAEKYDEVIISVNRMLQEDTRTLLRSPSISTYYEFQLELELIRARAQFYAVQKEHVRAPTGEPQNSVMLALNSVRRLDELYRALVRSKFKRVYRFRYAAAVWMSHLCTLAHGRVELREEMRVGGDFSAETSIGWLRDVLRAALADLENLGLGEPGGPGKVMERIGLLSFIDRVTNNLCWSLAEFGDESQRLQAYNMFVDHFHGTGERRALRIGFRHTFAVVCQRVFESKLKNESSHEYMKFAGLALDVLRNMEQAPDATDDLKRDARERIDNIESQLASVTDKPA